MNKVIFEIVTPPPMSIDNALEELLRELLGSQFPEGEKDPIYKILATKELLKILKTKNLELYKKLKILFVYAKVRELFPSPKRLPSSDEMPLFDTNDNLDNLKSEYLFVTQRLEINGKLYPLSQYLTWLYRSFQEDPFIRMRSRSKMIVIHMDLFLIEDMLKEIAKIFAEAVLCNREDRSQLMRQVGLMRYLFAHTMPFIRGSAAVGEWIESALFYSHGFSQFHVKPNRLVDLEAFSTLTLSEFLARYKEAILLGE